MQGGLCPDVLALFVLEHWTWGGRTGFSLSLSLYIYMHTYIHTYIHTYMHACMHACIHSFIHSYIPLSLSLSLFPSLSPLFLICLYSLLSTLLSLLDSLSLSLSFSLSSLFLSPLSFLILPLMSLVSSLCSLHSLPLSTREWLDGRWSAYLLVPSLWLPTWVIHRTVHSHSVRTRNGQDCNGRTPFAPRLRCLSAFPTIFKSRPGKPNQRKGQNEKFMNFAHFCEFWCFSLGKQERFTLNFCSGMPLRKVHELTFLVWFAGATPDIFDEIPSWERSWGGLD